MANIAVWLKVDEKRIVQTLHEASVRLDGVDGELTLDFSAVRRINPSEVAGLAELAGVANDKRFKVVLRGISVEIYRVLKLVKLASRFSYVS
ncbi:MAG: STAS domain-containing protein [Candidatus Sulfotelmatobacter sp.]